MKQVQAFLERNPALIFPAMMVAVMFFPLIFLAGLTVFIFWPLWLIPYAMLSREPDSSTNAAEDLYWEDPALARAKARKMGGTA